MVKQLGGVDLYFLLKELKRLEGARLEKIYNKGKEIHFHFYSGKKEVLVLVPGKGLYIMEKKHDSTPSNFCMFLRKYLRGSRLVEISQEGLERIVYFTFEKKEKYVVVFEIIWPGNIIVIKNNKILQSLYVKKYGDRWIKPGEIYSPPKPLMGIMDFKKSEKKDVVRFLAIDVGLGGKYAEELCFRAGIKKNTELNKLSLKDAKKIEEELRNFLEQKPCPHLNDELYVTEMKTKTHGKKYGDMNQAIRDYLVEEEKKQEKRDLSEKVSREIEDLKRKMGFYKERAEFLASNFDIIQPIFKEMRRAIREYGWSKTKELLDEYNGYEAKKVESISPEDNSITIEGVRLDVNKSLGENMNYYFDMAKKYERKIESAKNRINELSTKEKKKKEPPKIPKTWKDDFRWFESSEGFVIVSGKNAKQNEELLKKYMEAGDLVFHADIHGSPFTLVKKGKKCSIKTIEEAAQQTISYSKAWNLGMAGGDVYYIYPHQVTKQAPSGLYVPMGSFIVRGKKNFVKNVKLELAVGFAERIIAGPKSAIRKKTRNYVIIHPGSESKEKIAEKIKRILEKGCEYKINKDDIISVLPGDSVLLGNILF